MNDPVLKIKLLAKTEMTLAKLQARKTANQAVFAAVALFFVLLGLGMLNFAGYQALVSLYSPAISALGIAVIDMLLGVIILKAAFKVGKSSDEEKMAQEVRDMVYSEVSGEFDSVKQNFKKISDDVYNIRAGFGSVASGSAGLAGLVPLIELLTKTIKKKKERVPREK